ncbi:MAG TPA: phospholipid carrier-dependent glycosyltransferase [Candidatus Angelobacter sp.]|nr:phospholipid carrier-dependent glycosyltransferase [Candidatus Angelobacter sp.]
MTAPAHDVALPRWTRLDSGALALVTIVAAALRLVSLNRPIGLVFDEIFYAQDACWYVAGSEAVCGITDLVSRAHPPLGKWLIGSGIAAFGYEPFGWRIAVAVAGIATVALVYVLGWRLLRRTVSGTALTIGATIGAGLLALDFLHLVQSRVAMLDSLIVLFVVGAVTAIVLDRDRTPPADPPPWERAAFGRPWLLVAGVCLGAATAVKWSGAYVAPAVIGLVVIWAIVDRRRAEPGSGWGAALSRAARREALPVILLLGLVPVLAYAASYTGRMPGSLVGLPWEPGTVWRGIWDHQRAMLDFHTTLGGDHPYQSPPWSWPLLKRPVAFWFGADGGAYREILSMGNPVAWWSGLVALVALAVTWARSGWAWLRPEPVILGAAGATYLPWLILSGDRSQTFLWYFLPTVPFLCLALGAISAWAWSRLAGRVAVGLASSALLGSFVFFVPLLTALPLSPDDWTTRMLFRDCERPAAPTLTLPDDTISSGPPPDGWCWI